MIGLLQKVDKTFTKRAGQGYTAVNGDGFEVDVLRRPRRDGDQHPIRLSADEDDLWVTEAPRAEELSNAPAFSEIVVGTDGRMARMDTLHPAAFVHFKRWMSSLPDREAQKRRRDALQADVVEHVLHEYLPHLEETWPPTLPATGAEPGDAS